MERICRNCVYWTQDYGTFTATGWTGMGRDEGHCHYEPICICKTGSNFCHNWTDQASSEEPMNASGKV